MQKRDAHYWEDAIKVMTGKMFDSVKFGATENQKQWKLRIGLDFSVLIFKVISTKKNINCNYKLICCLTSNQ